MIERGIVRVEGGAATVHPIPAAAQKGEGIAVDQFGGLLGRDGEARSIPACRDPIVPVGTRTAGRLP